MFKKSATFTAIFIGIFAGLFVAPALAIINAPNASAYQLSVSTSGDTIINLDNGQVKTKTSRVGISTDCRAGYTWQIQGPADTNLYLSGDKTINEFGKYFTPASSASALNSQPNTYGYNLTTNQTDQIFTPLTSTAVTLKDFTDTASPSADINDTNNIHWGVNAGMTLNAGTYILADNEAVTYIVTTSPTCVNYYNISFDPNGGSGAQMPTQQITENTPTTLAKNTYTSSNDQDGFIGWNTQPDGSGTHYTDEQEVTLSGSNQNITLYAQWNCPASKICYFDNGASSPTTMDNQSASSNTATTLWPTNFQRKGYGFAGWAETPTPTTADIIYGPQQTLAAVQTGDLTTKGKKLYAVWIEAKDTIQNWTGCPKLTQATYSNGTVTANLSSVTALLDTRDGEAYAVAKLPDGNCWMIENLRLGSNTTITLTPNDTSINANLTFPASTTSFSNSYNTINSIRQNAINKLNTVANMTGTNANIYSYGVYYTWPAAIGSTSAYSSGSVSTSICPRGWTLPLGNTTSSGSFGALDVSIGGTGSNQNVSSAVFNRWRSYPNNFVYSGGYYTSRYSYRGSGAVYWTRTLYGESYGFNLLIDTGSSRILPGDAHDTKYNGETIRCIARSDYYTITFDKNGGTGTMPDQAIYRNTSTTLNPATFTAPAGQFFNGWNTSPDGTGTSYTDEQNVNNLAAAGATITLYAQWGGCPSGNICYSSNGVNSATTMDNQSISATDTSVSLLSSNFTNPGYGFVGWSDKADWVVNENDAFGNGTGANAGYHIYGPNYTLNFISGQFSAPNKGLALYAIWLAPSGNLQNWQGCDSLSVGQVIALKDTRDDSVYTVAKLEDGKCWMTENLHLGATTPLELTPADTDTTNNFTLKTTAWDGCNGEGDGDDPEACNDISNFFKPNRSNNTPHSSVLDGYLYNQYTATAGSATSDKAPGVVSTVTNSICPKGWHLPRYTNNATYDDFGDLYVALNAAQPATAGAQNMRAYPSNFVMSGSVYDLLWGGQGSHGYYHTGTSMGYSLMYAYYLSGASTARIDRVLKSTYASVRCIARNDYKVSFDANSGSGNMADQIIARGISAKLNANEFSAPSGFVFDGWNTEANGSGTSYANEATVTNLADAGETITLYAQWKDTRTGFDRMMTMQDMTSAICAEAAVGDTKRLRDTRDDKYYNIRKMEDGKCWMVQNLALMPRSDDDTLTSVDTDVADNFTWSSSDITTNTNGWGDASWNINHIYNPGNNWVESTSAGNSANLKTTGTPPNEGQYNGAYYNFHSATAGSGTNLTSGDAPYSICPKGWKLPTGGSSTSDWAGLTGALVGITTQSSSATTATDSFALQTGPAHLNLFDYYDASAGLYANWSRVAYTSSSLWTYATDAHYALYLATYEIDPSSFALNKHQGAVVRCVAR